MRDGNDFDIGWLDPVYQRKRKARKYVTTYMLRQFRPAIRRVPNNPNCMIYLRHKGFSYGSVSFQIPEISTSKLPLSIRV